jgi:hypothetical protein
MKSIIAACCLIAIADVASAQDSPSLVRLRMAQFQQTRTVCLGKCDNFYNQCRANCGQFVGQAGTKFRTEKPRESAQQARPSMPADAASYS